MNFDEYWLQLFPRGKSGPAFVPDRAGDLFPVRKGDRKVAEHFWLMAGHECLKAIAKVKS